MGQQASKRLAGSIQRASQRIIEKADAAEKAAVTTAANAPSASAEKAVADPRTGFYRGNSPVDDPRDVVQQRFLESKQGGRKSEDGVPEMPNVSFFSVKKKIYIL